MPLFFILVFALTWSSWLAAHFVPALKIPLLYLGIFAPAFVAIALTAWRKKPTASSRCCGASSSPT